MNKLNVSTSELIRMSQRERVYYGQTGNKSSPACVELFRRAFNGDEDAWSGIYRTFGLLVRRWIGIQSKVDPEDVLQGAFIQFFRYAPEKPDLLATESLGPIVRYLRLCVRSTLINIIRTSKGEAEVDLDGLMADELSDNNIIEQSNSMIVLEERLSELLKDHKERLTFDLRFRSGMPPRQIIDMYPDVFENYQEVAAIIQRLTRRFRKDPIMQELKDMSIGT